MPHTSAHSSADLFAGLFHKPITAIPVASPYTVTSIKGPNGDNTLKCGGESNRIVLTGTGLTKLSLNGAVLIQGGEEISDYSIEEQGSTDTEAALTLHVNGIAGDATITFACSEPGGESYSHTFQVVY